MKKGKTHSVRSSISTSLSTTANAQIYRRKIIASTGSSLCPQVSDPGQPLNRSGTTRGARRTADGGSVKRAGAERTRLRETEPGSQAVTGPRTRLSARATGTAPPLVTRMTTTSPCTPHSAAATALVPSKENVKCSRSLSFVACLVLRNNSSKGKNPAVGVFLTGSEVL